MLMEHVYDIVTYTRRWLVVKHKQPYTFLGVHFLDKDRLQLPWFIILLIYMRQTYKQSKLSTLHNN